MRNAFFNGVFLFFFSLLFSTEFRAIVQTDGKLWYAVFLSLSFSQEGMDAERLDPELLQVSDPYLSIREAMYIRNRLEEILDDDEEDEDAWEENGDEV
ncbi:MAG TPA: hypothetical protein PKH10_06130 [bacterium]|nr:hypothetical protein [bacterium]